MADGNRKLYEQLNRDGLYTKSYDEFRKQFSTPEKLYTLYTAMKSDGFYTKPMEEFKVQYFPPPEKSYIDIKDTRKKDIVTDTTLTDRNRLHAKVDSDLVKKIVVKAKEYGIDPYTALAIGYQETLLRDEYADNPMNLLSGDRLKPETAGQDILDLTMMTLNDKKQLAEKLGKTKEEEVLQAWNGYGKITAESFGGRVRKAYGIDISQEPIDMSTNPVYGRRVKDIRDNILKRNPQIIELVEGVSPLKQ